MEIFPNDKTTASVVVTIVEFILVFLVVAVFTTFILWIVGAAPLLTYYYIWVGALGSTMKLSQVISTWIPLTLSSCGLIFTFRVNLWNIGIEGQIMMGAVFSAWILRMSEFTPFITLLLAFIAGWGGGGMWALVAGYLRTKAGVNEIFTGLGLNFVAQGIILWLIFGPWKRPGIASMSGTELFPKELWLPTSSWLRLSPVSFFMAIGVILITVLILNHSRLGLILKAVGYNSKSASLFNLKPNIYLLVAMLCAGGFAGLAGAVQVSSIYHRLLPSISSNYGYLALLVVMLSGFNVWLTPVVSFFFACLNVGSIQLPMMMQLDSSLSGVIQGAFVLSMLVVKYYSGKRKKITTFSGVKKKITTEIP